MKCLICQSDMTGPYQNYWFECRQCGFLASTLKPTIGGQDRSSPVDENLRRMALDQLRHQNFERVLNRIQQSWSGHQGHLLDVGCAHGWFLEAAGRRGYIATGIEPDPVIADQTRLSGQKVMTGFFPEDLPPQETFDIITFLDVFEHLCAPNEAAAACFQRLTPGGLLVLVVPNCKGILFRLARLFSRLGWQSPLDRLWQRGFPSPHLSYFHPAILAELLRLHGFTEIQRSNLPSFSRQGLWHRLRYDRRSSIFLSALQLFLLTILSPTQSLFTSDISLQVFSRGNSQS